MRRQENGGGHAEDVLVRFAATLAPALGAAALSGRAAAVRADARSMLDGMRDD